MGMLRLLMTEFEECLADLSGDDRKREVSLATGCLAYPYLENLLKQLQTKYPNVKTHLYKIQNEFFGEKITLSGLITGKDLMNQLQGKELGTNLLLPCNMLRDGEEVFLDDITLIEIKETLQVEVDIVKSSGQDFIESIIGEKYE